jgi:hypothetical protein
MAKEIPLTNGQVAVVDDEDYLRASQHGWYALKHRGYGETTYLAMTSIKDAAGVWTPISLHRFLLDARPGDEVDHRDLNPLNCQRHNLRFATRAQNAQNRRKFKNNQSGYKGVYKRNNRRNAFRAQITCNGVQRCIGSFPTALDAARAYDREALRLHGEFARINGV